MILIDAHSDRVQYECEWSRAQISAHFCAQNGAIFPILKYINNSKTLKIYVRSEKLDFEKIASKSVSAERIVVLFDNFPKFQDKR